ncbi:MAG: hypothetical protein K9N35_03140 [Candidatus Marinimicrobia bacterium]|nr:hypothetical protein [Candidatus Neomarinimicrobiota bacterium]
MKICTPILVGAILAFSISIFSHDDWLTLERKIQNTHVITQFDEPPVYLGSLKLSDDKNLRPFAFCSTDQYRFLSYHNKSLVDIFDTRFKFIKRLDLSHEGKGSITGITADHDHIYMTDSQIGDLRIYDLLGTLIQRIAWLPDHVSRLRPYGITLHDGVLYVTDRKLQQVMAINIMEKPGISEPGELIFSAPDLNGSDLDFFAPGYCIISPDGRLLVSTLHPANVRVFSCNGRDMGLLVKPESNALQSPQGMAFDNIPSPKFLARADSVFDPSGIYQQGRLHIADSETGMIHVFDPSGTQILTYGEELESPINLAIDNEKRLIMITDMASTELKFYKF